MTVSLQLIARISRKKDNIRRRMLRSGAVNAILNAMRRNKRVGEVQRCGCLALIALTERSEKHQKHLGKAEFNATSVVVEAIREHIEDNDPVLLTVCLQLLHRLLVYTPATKHALLVDWVIKAMDRNKDDVRLQETGLLFLNRCELEQSALNEKQKEVNQLVKSIRDVHRRDQDIQALVQQLMPLSK